MDVHSCSNSSNTPQVSSPRPPWDMSFGHAPTRSNTLGFYALISLIVLTFFNGWIKQYELLPDIASKLIQQGLVFLLLLSSLQHIRNYSRVFWLLLLYLGWAICSMLYNSTELLSPYLYSRIFLSGGIVFLYIFATPITPKELRSIWLVLGGLSIFQIPLAIFNIFSYGVTEYRVGSIDWGGGGLAAFFPLICLAYGIGFFTCYRKKWWALLLFCSFLLIGVASGKRSICLMYPVFVILGFLIYLVLCRSFVTLLKTGILLILVSVGIMVLSIDFLGNMRRFEDIDNVGTLGDKIEYILEQVEMYENVGSNRGTTSGRIANNMMMLEFLRHPGSADFFWFGSGPMSCEDSSDYSGMTRYYFGYGTAGWATDILSIGIVGFLAWIFFYMILGLSPLWRLSFNQLNPFGQMLMVGNLTAFSVILFTHFSYSGVLLTSLAGTLPFLIGSALLLSPVNRHFFSVVR